MQKGALLYSGKAKSVFESDEADKLIIEFRNDASAFDGIKKASLKRKGEVNNRFNEFIMEKLAAAGIPNHHLQRISANESVVRRLDMLPVECVVRNVAAGSLCKRLGVEEGLDLNPPIFEFFLKNDELHDPMINDYHVRTFGWARDEDIARMKEQTFAVNEELARLFDAAGLILVDYKLEFGCQDGQLYLGDEFSPDGCRLWDKETRKKMDKDRFRQDLGDVIEAYEEVAGRLGIDLG